MIQFKSDHINITPTSPSRLTGMRDDQISEGIYNVLELNVVFFQEFTEKVMLFSIDTLFISKDLILFIKQEVKKSIPDICENNIILTASHTHYAPSLEEKRFALGNRDDTYFSYLKDKISRFLFNFLNFSKFYDLVKVELNSMKTSNVTCNRRRKVRVLKDLFNLFISMEPNLNGFKNEEFKIIKFYNKLESKPTLVFWSFPCHLTNLHVNNLISSEFPGLIREDLRNKMSDNSLNVLYFPGLAGDVRAYPPSRSLIKRKVRDIFRLSYPVNYYRFINEVEYLNWYKKLNLMFWRAWDFNSELKFDYEKNISSKKTILNLKEIGVQSDYVEDIIFRKIKIGDLFSLYTISAEPVSFYSQLLENNKKDDFFIFTGYTDEVFGYLPSNKYILEGGYESEGYFTNFLVTGKFIKKLDEKICEVISKLN